MWNVLSFTLAKAGNGRAFPPVTIYIPFTYFIILLLISKQSNIVHIINIGVNGPITVCMNGLYQL